jgi:hypothetical protein
MSLAAWWRRVTARPAPIPPAPADTLGAATLPSVVIPPKPAAPAPVIGWGVPPEAIALSKAFEGFCNLPYRCQAGVWTIGYGSTRDKAGHPVNPSTPRITEAEAAFALGMAPDEAKRRAWAEINTPDDWPPLPP